MRWNRPALLSASSLASARSPRLPAAALDEPGHRDTHPQNSHLTAAPGQTWRSVIAELGR